MLAMSRTSHNLPCGVFLCLNNSCWAYVKPPEYELTLLAYGLCSGRSRDHIPESYADCASAACSGYGWNAMKSCATGRANITSLFSCYFLQRPWWSLKLSIAKVLRRSWRPHPACWLGGSIRASARASDQHSGFAVGMKEKCWGKWCK